MRAMILFGAMTMRKGMKGWKKGRKIKLKAKMLSKKESQ